VAALISFALRHRFLVLVATLAFCAAGVYSIRRLPIDAVPDITPNQVVVLTNAPGLSPVEVEQYLTFPVETSMTGLPGITSIQSVSINGLSYVAVYFEDGLDVYFCRRLVMERLAEARERIPGHLGVPEMGPIATGLGEIFQFKVTGPGRSLMELRTILDWEIAPKLRTVPGVVEVNSHGGELRTYEVELDNHKLAAYGITLRKILSALDENNASAGGAYLERFEQQALIRGEALISSLSDIENIVLGVSPSGTPILIRNVADVRFAPMVRQGFATEGGKGEIVVGVAMMLIGENAADVAGRVRDRIASLGPYLPPGVKIVPLYDRTDLVHRTIRTVGLNLTEGGLLVVGVLLVMLGTLRGSLVIAAAIPLSMMVAFTGMLSAGISGNLMSLGAIDFGLIVDGSVVMIENILRRLGYKPAGDRLEAIRHAAVEVARPIFFGVLIIFLVYVPVLLLGGIEGKMFKPMASTVLFAVAGSLAVALVVMPVLASLVFRKPVADRPAWLVRQSARLYAPLLRGAIRRPGRTAAVALVAVVLSVWGASYLGAEFIPRLDEGSLLIQMYRLPGISITESLHGNEIIEKVLLSFPEVKNVYSRTGRAEVAVDPMAIDQSDVYIFLHPPARWPPPRTREELVEDMRRKLRERAPGAVYSFSQPIQMRTQEMMESGVRADVAVKIFGDDMDVLREKAAEVARVLERVPGSADVRAERVAGMPYIRVKVRRESIARHGLNAADVLATVETIGGKVAGEVVEGNRRVPLQVRLHDPDRTNIDAIRQLKVGDDEGHFIPLDQLADIVEEEGPAQISRENARRRVNVEANVRGRDLAGFVAEARAAVARAVPMPEGYSLEWGGQFEQLTSASRRLAVAVPLALATIYSLLYIHFQSFRLAALILLNVPVAASGGIFALLARGMPFSVSAGVGFIALFGIAVLNGVVLLSYVRQLGAGPAEVERSVFEGAMTRLRPVLSTALVASLGFLPMALSHGAGAEVQRPLATVVIGGLATSTVLTLLVLPSFYVWLEKRRAVA
jgi:cobalt-zinc-cadmium resistance protein CzcA